VSCDAIEADEAGVDADVDIEAEADADVDTEADADDAGWYRDDAMTFAKPSRAGPPGPTNHFTVYLIKHY
jgi:hypothetical protein